MPRSDRPPPGDAATGREAIHFLLPAAAACLLDQAIKRSILAFGSPPFIGSYHLAFNPGLAAGAFEGLPPMTREVMLSTFGAAAVALTSALQFLIRARARLFRVGLGIWVGGILGNMLDRAILGHVIDYWVVPFSGGRYACNFADICLNLGFALAALGLALDLRSIFSPGKRRSFSWLSPYFQARLHLWLLWLVTASTLIGGLYGYSFVRAVLTEDLRIDGARVERILRAFAFGWALSQVTFLSVLLVWARLYTMRVAGPVFAVNRYLRDRMAGRPRDPDRPFTLRRGDQFPELEQLVREIDLKL